MPVQQVEVRIVRLIMEGVGVDPEKLRGEDPDAVLARLAELKGGEVAFHYATLRFKLPTGDARNAAIAAALKA